MSPGNPRVGLVDYGTGNFTSVRNALTHVGCTVDPLGTPAEIESAERIVLPGVGAFGACMRRLSERDLAEPIRSRLAGGETPFLGICVGMQMLASVGREFGEHPGLDVIAGQCDRVEADGRRLPHVGWNLVEPAEDVTLFEGIGRASFYFVHSFELTPTDPTAVLATCEYGGPVTAAVRSGSVYGVQFHPEKSQAAGLRLLRNFATADAAALVAGEPERA